MDRFMDPCMPEPTSGCWLWLGDSSFNGYMRRGRFRIGKKRVMAPRAAYELFRGPIPDGMYALHKCDVSLCVNPDHLFLGTLSDNSNDMFSKKRHRTPKGNNHHNAKIRACDVPVIRWLRTNGCSLSSIAKTFGVVESNICAITRGRTWSHIK